MTATILIISVGIMAVLAGSAIAIQWPNTKIGLIGLVLILIGIGRIWW